MGESNYKVLVVDDSRMNRLKITRALSTDGYDVAEASGGREAMEMLRSQEFHLVLLDILMPEIDGFQVLEQIKNDHSLSGIPVIMVSAVDEKEDVERCLALGAADYVAKSSDAETLKNLVRYNLKGAPD